MLDNYSKVWQLQAFINQRYDSYANTYIPTSMQPRSIAIPRSYTEVLCRYCFMTSTTESAGVEQLQLESLIPNQKLMSELFLVYEGKDNLFYYFHAEQSANWVDNNAFIYAR